MWALLLLSIGCTYAPLSEVEIDGGTDWQREQVRAELAAFDEWVGPGRVEIRKVEFRDLGDDDGLWRPHDRTVLLDLGLPTDRVREMMRHELCHALDDAESLIEEQEALLDDIGAVIDRDRMRPERLREEALAEMCETAAPPTMSLVAQACPRDDPQATAVAEWMMERVWTNYTPPEPGTLGDAVSFVLPAPEGPTGPWPELALLDSPDPAVLFVGVSEDLSAIGWFVDRTTGERAPFGEFTIPDLADEPPGEAPLSGTLVPLWDDGLPSLALHQIELSGLGAQADRLVWLSEAEAPWAPVEGGCVPAPVWAPFVSQGSAWVAVLEDGVVTWAPVVDGGP